MKVPQIRIQVEEFRAIDNADIVVDGITVVAGDNGSGKSTLSKLLYYIFKTACQYDELVENELKGKINIISTFLDIYLSELAFVRSHKQIVSELRSRLNDLNNTDYFNEQTFIKWDSLLRSASLLYFEVFNTETSKIQSQYRSRRISHILRSIVSGVEDREPSFDDLANLIHSYFKEAEGKRQSRPRTLLVSALRNVFTEGLLPRNFELFEFDDPIVSSKKNNLSKPFSIQNTVYIDTPMSIGLNQTDVQHWDDLNRLVLAKGTRSNDFILNVISKDIIFGDADINDSSRSSIGYTFKRNDGNAFNLLDCATGIKAFAIIQLLLRNGTINEKTLLIIDEPEVHLHPQWIVEYARIIVLLNKKMGVKFFITSHDPDFVSAIRYLSEKEGILESVNFYLAEKTENTFTYKYRNLGHEIDPIFQSFNQAIDKIDKYSE